MFILSHCRNKKLFKKAEKGKFSRNKITINDKEENFPSISET
jgi:hypothetical protein